MNYSIVFQDVTLFNNTVMENIRIGRKGATDAEVMAADDIAELGYVIIEGYRGRFSVSLIFCHE